MARAAIALLAVFACACGQAASAGSAGSDGFAVPSGFAGPCSLSLAGDPIPIVSFQDRHATAPSMIVLDTGATSGAASVAIQVFANAGTSGLPDDIEIARARVASPWPAGATLDEQPQLLGEFTLGPGLLAQPLHGPPTLALAWHRDNAAVGRPQFRSLDVATWAPGPDVQLSPSGDAVFSFVAGPGVAEDGSWSGEGFAIAWRNVGAPGIGPARPLAALVDPVGNVLRGPSPLARAEDYPGRAPAIVWTGSEYLVATTYGECRGGDACLPRSVVVGRLAATQDVKAGLTLQPIVALTALDEAAAPGSAASMATLGGRVWIAWTEGPPTDGAGAARVVRLATLDAHGQPIGAPITVAAAAHPASRVAVSASDAGVLLAWAEDSPRTADGGGTSDIVPGASFVVVQRVAFDGSVDAPVRIPATRIDDYGPPTASAIASPHGAVVLWAGRSVIEKHFDETYLARLDCVRSGTAQ